MEHTNCLICDRDKTVDLFTGHDRLFGIDGFFNVVRCSRCGFVYLNPRPTIQEMRRYYPEHYYSLREWKEKIGFLRSRYRKLKWKDLSYGHITRFPGVPRFIPHGKILDFGCGSGEVLHIFRNMGWSAYGVEIDESAAEFARSRGLDVFHEDLKSIHFPDNHFDVIRMRSVLEHLHDVPAILDEFYRILKKGGQLLLIVPNIDSLEFKLFREKWYSLDIPRHIYHFSIKSLKNLLEKFRFHDLSFRTCGGSRSFLASIDYLLNEKRGSSGLRLANKIYLRIPAFLMFSLWLNILRCGNLIEAQAYKT